MVSWLLRALAALCLSALTACVVPGATAPTQLTVLGGGMTVTAPRGYCVDPKASRESGDTAVVLIGRCTVAADAAPALISVSIGAGGSAGAMTAGGAALAQFFTSTAGRKMLSRAGRAADVQVIRALQAEGTFLMYLADRAIGSYWRAVTGLNGRLVTISVSGAAGVPLTSAQGRALLDATLSGMRMANPG